MGGRGGEERVSADGKREGRRRKCHPWGNGPVEGTQLLSGAGKGKRGRETQDKRSKAPLSRLIDRGTVADPTQWKAGAHCALSLPGSTQTNPAMFAPPASPFPPWPCARWMGATHAHDKTHTHAV